MFHKSEILREIYKSLNVETFKSSDMKFFNFSLTKSKEKKDIIIFEKKIIYRDVHLFVRQVKRIIKFNFMINDNLHLCLRELIMT